MTVPPHRRLALIPLLSCALAGAGRAEDHAGHAAPDPHVLPPVEKHEALKPLKPPDPHAEIPAVPTQAKPSDSHHVAPDPHASPTVEKHAPKKLGTPHAEASTLPALPAETKTSDPHHAAAESHAVPDPHAPSPVKKTEPRKPADPHAETPAVPSPTPKHDAQHGPTSPALPAPAWSAQAHGPSQAHAPSPAHGPAQAPDAPTAHAGDGHGKPVQPKSKLTHPAPAAHAAAPAGHAVKNQPAGTGGHAGSHGDHASKPPAPGVGDPAYDSPELRELLGHLRELEAEVGLVRREHADPPESAELWAAARRGLVKALDPHSSWLDRDEVALRGSGDVPLGFGFGFDWVVRDGKPTVVRVVPGSSASSAGLEAGLIIVRAGDTLLDGQPGAALVRAFNALPDRAGFEVATADGAKRTVEVLRSDLTDTGLGICDAPDARGLARITIGRFFAPRPDADGRPATLSTAQALAGAVAKAASARAIVLDLRGCGGGNLQVAVDALACFLPPEAIVAHQVSRNPARNRTLTVPQPGTRFTGPIAVLLDRHSASAAEVFAAALQHHRRAVVVGERSAGKTSVQQLFLLPSGDAMLLTVAKLRRPDQSEPAGGIDPDLPASRLPGTADTVLERARDALAAILAAGR